MPSANRSQNTQKPKFTPIALSRDERRLKILHKLLTLHVEYEKLNAECFELRYDNAYLTRDNERLHTDSRINDANLRNKGIDQRSVNINYGTQVTSIHITPMENRYPNLDENMPDVDKVRVINDTQEAMSKIDWYNLPYEDQVYHEQCSLMLYRFQNKLLEDQRIKVNREKQAEYRKHDAEQRDVKVTKAIRKLAADGPKKSKIPRHILDHMEEFNISDPKAALADMKARMKAMLASPSSE